MFHSSSGGFFTTGWGFWVKRFDENQETRRARTIGEPSLAARSSSLVPSDLRSTPDSCRGLASSWTSGLQGTLMPRNGSEHCNYPKVQGERYQDHPGPKGCPHGLPLSRHMNRTIWTPLQGSSLARPVRRCPVRPPFSRAVAGVSSVTTLFCSFKRRAPRCRARH